MSDKAKNIFCTKNLTLLVKYLFQPQHSYVNIPTLFPAAQYGIHYDILYMVYNFVYRTTHTPTAKDSLD